MATRLILIPLLFLTWTAVANKGLGAPNFKCDPKVMAPSAQVPTNVNQVRFADIKVIGALGDSLTAANGAGALGDDPLAVILQYRGLCFHAGGDMDLSQHITVPNILRKFNPNLFGYSTGIGSENVWEISKLNMGIPGAHSGGLLDQAHIIVQTMQSHSDKIDITNDWKLINIFIGGNDVCSYCKDPASHPPHQFSDNIAAAVKVLKDNLPRTIVSLTGMFNMKMLRQVDSGQIFCDDLHVFECHCESDKNFTNPQISNVSIGMMIAEQTLQDSGMFEADDFTLVIQPYFEDVTVPPMLANGDVDLSFFAPDCFHFSRFGHAIVGKHLWNTIVQPVGQKMRKANLSDASPTVNCPLSSCPFFPTVKNSKSCSQFWTPSTLDV